MSKIKDALQTKSRDELKKALLESDFSSGATLNAEQNKEWMTLIQGQSVYLDGSKARVELVKNLKQELPRLHFGEPITISADEVDDGTDTNKPKVDDISADCKKIKIRTTQSYTSLLHAVGQKDFETVLLNAVKKRAAVDAEFLAFLGDVDAYTGSTTAYGKLLVRLNGWYYRARTMGRVVDAGGGYLTIDLLQDAVDTMPDWMWMDSTRWIGSRGILNDFRRLLQAKTGGDVLATSLLERNNLKPLGIEWDAVPAIPNNLQITTQAATPGNVLGDQYGPFKITSAANKMSLTIEGTTKVITLTTGLQYASQIAKTINDAFGIVYAKDWGGRLYIFNRTAGAGHDVVINATANDAYTLLGLTAATYSGVAASGGGQVYEGSFIMLTEPSNLVWVKASDTRMTVKYDEDLDAIKIVIFDHYDAIIENPDSVVLIDNVRKARASA